MIRSLRLRFFLIMWPLIVLAVAGVAYAFNRWTEVQLTEQLFETRAPMRGGAFPRVDSVARAWADGAVSDSVLGARFAAIAAGDSVGLVLIGARGRIVASSDAHLALARPLDTLPAGPVAFERTVSNGGILAQERLELNGQPVADRRGVTRGVVFVLPAAAPAATPVRRVPRAAALRADARRTMWVVVAVASVVAAVLALLLAGPLVRQVTRLAGAAARVQAGDLSARVGAGGGDELGRLGRAFNDMAAALERAEAHQRNLVHDVAHELRTPLTNVVGILEAIEDGLRAPDEATLATLRAEAGLLAALVSDLQELSLAESGQLEFVCAPVDVVAESAAAVASMREVSGGVTLEAPGGAAVMAMADPRRLRQVLRNLLGNAIRHTPAGGRVKVEVREAGAEVGIVVSDTGSGIPAEHLELVWERFHRVDPSRDRSGGGRGLGLAIVRQFVAGMGGRVAVSSTVGAGSVFEVWLRAGAETVQKNAE